MTAFRRVPTPDNPIIGNPSQRNPTGYGRGSSPRIQDDEMSTALLRQALEEGIVPIDQILARLDARNQPPQLTQGKYLKFITAAATPVLLIPRNKRRQSLSISNFTDNGDIVMSYDFPDEFGQVYAGNLIPASTPPFVETNGSVSMNDIYVVCNDTQATFPIPVLGYEGCLSLTGNPR